MKILPVIIGILFLFLCDRNDSTLNPVHDPFVNIPDTLQEISLPNYTHYPLITVGNGTVSGCTAESLEKAIDSLGKMKKGGVINFSTGGAVVTIPLSQCLKIISPDSLLVIDGGNLVTIDGQNRCRIIECSNYAHLVLTNVRLINGVSDSSGAALLHPWYGTLACYNVTFLNNRCTVRGPEFGGGAVFAGGLKSALFVKCTFTDNCGSNGGAILNRGTNLNIDSCIFNHNVATGNGGGKDAGATGLGGIGGAVYIDGMNYENAQPFYLRNTVFTGNISHCHGSAVFSYYYKDKPGTSGALIETCEFDGNADSGTIISAGTLYHEGAPLKLHLSTFADNVTLKHAGALFLGPDATTEIVNCTFFRNTTPGNGGAIFGGRQKIKIINSTFYGNAGSYGPAIFNDVPDAVMIRNTLFVNNVPIINPYAYCNCTATYTPGAHVFQWPQKKSDGNADNPCINGVVFVDPHLDSLSYNGESTKTMAIDKSSSIVGICDSCPATDQRGVARKKRCDAGAYESQ